MRAKIQLSTADGYSGTKKSNEAMVATVVRPVRVCVLREYGVRRQVLCCSREDVFTLNLLYKDIL
jgi:hypothetical protein